MRLRNVLRKKGFWTELGNLARHLAGPGKTRFPCPATFGLFTVQTVGAQRLKFLAFYPRTVLF